jgi:hypothetical protein
LGILIKNKIQLYSLSAKLFIQMKNLTWKFLWIFLSVLLIWSCSEQSETNAQSAEVLDVKVSGVSNDYLFSVTVKSPDKGCEQYADWWEVLTPEGDLIYRRILLHSHVNEQPFTRTGGPVPVGSNREVIIRAHMNPKGYGSKAMRGTVSGGFEQVTLSSGFAASLEKKEPLPEGCTF